MHSNLVNITHSL